ncbi:hypothetical protein SAMN04488033_1026 [Salegentibacter agarivorans]|uniref:Uncharacterized protein n=1 Tax=Salegentibacter agarivorans TaxID=345907 RepID=A0A1I2K6L4_9FLAO|nr:hypothetical protein SAMN04488033_1026 [Salegentibacter agarivorans]
MHRVCKKILSISRRYCFYFDLKFIQSNQFATEIHMDNFLFYELNETLHVVQKEQQINITVFKYDKTGVSF